MPAFTDLNAFKGDALGGTLAFALWALWLAVQLLWRARGAGSRDPALR